MRLSGFLRFTVLVAALVASPWMRAQASAVTSFDSLVRDYNAIVFGNASFNQHESEGKLAIGGNLAITNFNVATKGSTYSTSSDPSLYVAGQLTINGNASLNYGSAYLPGTTGSLQGNQFFTSGGGTLNLNGGSTLTTSGPSDWNWTSIQQQTVSLSQSLATATPMGSVGVNGQTLTFNSNSSAAGAVVFSLDLSLLSSTTYNGTYFSNIAFNLASNQTAVINVVGMSGNSTLFGGNSVNFNANDDLASRLLWNVSGTGALTVGNGSGTFYGSILAPSVNLTSTGTKIGGQVVVNTLTYSGGELWDKPFTPVGVSILVPEPATYAVWGAVLCLAGLGWRAVRRRRVAAVRPVISA